MNELIWSKLIAIQNDIEAIEKKKGEGINYKFRGIDDLYNAIHPLHKKYGVIIIPRVMESTRENRTSAKGNALIYSLLDIEYDFVAEDGSKATVKTRGEAMDSGDKATNKAMSIALKYALLHMYLIPTEDLKEIDPDAKAEVLSGITKDDIDELRATLNQADSKEEVLAFWKKEYLNEPTIRAIFDIRRAELMKAGKWEVKK